jgi:hypothetical protein
MNDMQKTPQDPNPANNSIYKDVLKIKDFLASLYIPVDVYVTNYIMQQEDQYSSYYQDTTPDTVGNFMIRGTLGQQNVNVATFKRGLDGFTNNIEKLRHVYNLFVAGGDFYGWLFNFDWFRETADHIIGVRLNTIK